MPRARVTGFGRNCRQAGTLCDRWGDLIRVRTPVRPAGFPPLERRRKVVKVSRCVIAGTVLPKEAAYGAFRRRPLGLPDTRPGHPPRGLDWPATGAQRAPIQATSSSDADYTRRRLYRRPRHVAPTRLPALIVCKFAPTPPPGFADLFNRRSIWPSKFELPRVLRDADRGRWLNEFVRGVLDSF